MISNIKFNKHEKELMKVFVDENCKVIFRNKILTQTVKNVENQQFEIEDYKLKNIILMNDKWIITESVDDEILNL
jgi:hypothetical protein